MDMQLWSMKASFEYWLDLLIDSDALMVRPKMTNFAMDLQTNTHNFKMFHIVSIYEVK